MAMWGCDYDMTSYSWDPLYGYGGESTPDIPWDPLYGYEGEPTPTTPTSDIPWDSLYGYGGEPTPDIPKVPTWTSEWVKQFDPEALGYVRDDAGNWIAPAAEGEGNLLGDLWGGTKEFFGSDVGKVVTQGLLGFASAWLSAKDKNEQDQIQKQARSTVQNQGYNPQIVDAFFDQLSQYQQAMGYMPTPGLAPEARDYWQRAADYISQYGMPEGALQERAILEQAMPYAMPWEQYRKAEQIYQDLINRTAEEQARRSLKLHGAGLHRGGTVQQILEEMQGTELAAAQNLANLQTQFAPMFQTGAAQLAAQAGQLGRTYPTLENIPGTLATLQAPQTAITQDLLKQQQLLFPSALSQMVGYSQQGAGGTQTMGLVPGTEPNRWYGTIADALSQAAKGFSAPTTGGTTKAV